MDLSQRLEYFNFNVESLMLLQELNTSREEMLSNLTPLGLNENLLNLVLQHSNLFNIVMLRLNIYSRSNTSESVVRQKLSCLNNSMVTDLLNHLFSSDSTLVTQNVSVVSNEPTVSAESNMNLENVEQENDDSETELEDVTTRLNTFFSECVQESEDSTHVVKTSEFYSALSSWWENKFETTVPDKKELKTYLSSRLGKATKNTWSNVSLSG